jgi:hypothetical protein
LLTLELRRPRWGQAVPDVCTVEVHAVGPRRTEILLQYLKKGRDVLVEGHLREEDGRLCVSMESFRFLSDGLTSTDLLHAASLEEQAAA